MSEMKNPAVIVSLKEGGEFKCDLKVEERLVSNFIFSKYSIKLAKIFFIQNFVRTFLEKKSLKQSKDQFHSIKTMKSFLKWVQLESVDQMFIIGRGEELVISL